MKQATTMHQNFLTNVKGFHAGRAVLAAVLLLQPVGSFAAAVLNAEGPVVSSAAKPLPSGSTVALGSASLKSVAYEGQRLLIHLDKTVAYRVFSLSQPPRLVVELSGTVHAPQPYEAMVDDGIVKRIRSAQFQTQPDKVTRVVVELPRLVDYAASQEGDDIILQFGRETARAASAPAPQKEAPEVLSGEEETSFTSTASQRSSQKGTTRKPKDIVASLPKSPVAIDFDEADIRDVIRVLSEMSGINMIHGPDVRGFVTIHLDQVPFNEAFSTLLTMQGLVAQQMGDNVLRILTPDSLSSDRARSVKAYKTFTLNYAKAADVVPHMSAVRISPSATVTVDEQSNSLIITDTPEGLAAAERLIADLDRRPEQVMIEAKMVEVILSDNLDLGVQWEYAGLNQGAKNTQVVGTRGTSGSPSVPFGGAELAPTGPGTRGTGVNLPGLQQSAITFGFVNNTDLLTVTLNALAQKGQTKILSSPKVITINNKQARIQVGSRIPFLTTTVAATGAATQSTTFVEVGIILTVTPTINADDRVRLKVRPEVSFPGTIGAAGPEINTRNAETEVIIRDGETLVVGGLIDEQSRESGSKVPLLGDIPVLGVFFRNSSESKRRSELLVFLTPRVIRE